MRPPVPALATRVDRHAFPKGWIYERKLDGERCLATKHAGTVILHSRSGRDITGSFPSVVDALADQDTADFVVDGEAVVFDGDATSFAAIQPLFHLTDPARARATGIEVFYYVFDVLEIDDVDTRRLPLIQRKALLTDLLTYQDPLRLTPYRDDVSAAYLAQACARGWEGLIGKRANSAYVPGRTGDWVKLKCEKTQEFVIGGYSDPQGSRFGFGALLIGYFDGDDLVYAGKVGTGFNRRELERVMALLQPLGQSRCPFTRGSPPARGSHWVRPEMVAQIGFGEWTRADQLRHPRYLGLRRDKAATDVCRES